MGKYIKLFNSHSDYEDFTESEDFILPNVSRCDSEKDIHYSHALSYQDYLQKYLTFVPKENTTFSFSTNNINYSLDNGTTWITLTAGQSTPTINSGQKVLWKANGLTPTSSAGIGTFSSTGQFEAYGNTMSLVYGDDFENNTTISNYQFLKLFYNCTNLTDVQNLILPATITKSRCYQNMFSGCTSIVDTPLLSASSLEFYCYYQMFQGCSSLKFAELTGSSSSFNEYSFDGWLYGISTNGILIKNPSLSMVYSARNAYFLSYPTTWTLISSFTLITIDSEGIFTTNPSLWILLHYYNGKTLEIFLNGTKFTGVVTKVTDFDNGSYGSQDTYTFNGTSDNGILELKQRYYGDRSGSWYNSVQYKVTGTNFQANDIISYKCKIIG